MGFKHPGADPDPAGRRMAVTGHQCPSRQFYVRAPDLLRPGNSGRRAGRGSIDL